MPVRKKENIIYVGLLEKKEKKKKKELQQTVNRGTRNLNMHLYSSRSLTEHYICLAQNKIELTEKEMLVYVQKKIKKKETTRL